MATEVSRQTVRAIDLANIMLTIITYDDGSKGILSPSAGANGSIALDAAALAALETTTAVQGAAGSAAWLVGGTTFTVASSTLTRPANATPYSQFDIIAAQPSGTTVQFIEWDTARVNGSGYITKGKLETDRATESAQYRLWLYRVLETALTTRLTNLGDNDVFPLKFANHALRIGYLDFTTWVSGGAGSDSAFSFVSDIRIAYGLAVADSKIYGLLTNLNAQTPQTSQNFVGSLTFESNT